jgi:hypothetical protein
LPTAKLILFVIKSRLSRPLLMFTLFIVAYGLASGAFLYTHHVALPASEVRSERAMAVIYSAIVVFLSSFMGGITVLKSDRDYLFTLPISRLELASSLYVGQLTLSGLLVVAWLGWYLPFIEVSLAYAVPDLVLFVLLITSLSASIAELPMRQRSLAALAVAAWSASGIWNPVSPSGFLHGYYLPGTLTLAALSLGLTAYVTRRLGNAPLLLGGGPSTTPTSRPEGGGLLSFSGVRGLSAVRRMKLNTIILAGRVGGFGAAGSRYVSRRMTVRSFVGYLTIVAAALLAISIALQVEGLLPANYQLQLRASNSGALGALPFFLVYLPALVLETLLMGVSSMDVINERPWLSFTSVSPGAYLRASAVSWAVVALLSALPFSAAYATMYLLLGMRLALNIVPQLLLSAPSFAVLSYFASAYVVMAPQLRFEGFTSGQANLRGLVLSLMIMVLVFLLLVSMYSLAFSLYAAAASLIATVPLISFSGPWGSASRRLVEKGYV